MRSIRMSKAGTPLEERPRDDPHPGPGEVVLEIRAAGICHSDAHYRKEAGRTRAPITLGHEIAGTVLERGPGVSSPADGARVAVHYLVGCGCSLCLSGAERFCRKAEMLGKDRDGGYAELVAIPAGNAVSIPDSVPFDHAAVMMCSSATALHALRLADLRRGETVLVIGFGGLGASAVQLAQAMGAGPVLAADIVASKLEAAHALGAEALDVSTEPMQERVAESTGGRGVDVALDFAGSPVSRSAALRSLAPGGRLVLVALNSQPFEFDPYRDVLARERRILGCSDHLLADLSDLMVFAEEGKLDLSRVVTRTVPLEAGPINAALDELETGTSHFRTVIRPRA
ncbi:MAG: alcohol dehydrogenase catalytic domain-containing protein [Thermoanaerobaculia bacterium]